MMTVSGTLEYRVCVPIVRVRCHTDELSLRQGPSRNDRSLPKNEDPFEFIKLRREMDWTKREKFHTGPGINQNLTQTRRPDDHYAKRGRKRP